MNNEIIISNREPQQITINGGGQVLGIVSVLVNGVDVTEGSVAYVVVPTKLSELLNDVGFINHEVDPTVPYFVKQITQADINRWNNKQELLVSGTNIKTINGNNILGSGNLDISTSYSAGTGIEITEENVINNTITSYDDLTDLPTIPTATSDLLNDSGFLTENDVSDVALTGSYLDLSNTPTIPSATSELVNDSGFITKEVNDLENYFNYDYLYNYVLPKVSDSDTNVNLNGTMPNLPLNITLSPSELSQAGTPTPSSPQDIHTISGSNTIKVEGKNLFNNNFSDYTRPNDYRICPIKLDVGKTYTLSSNLVGTSMSDVTVGIVPYGEKYSDFSGVMVLTLNSGNTINRIVTIPSTWTSPKLVVYASTEAKFNEIFENYNIQLEVGNQATTYTPYVSQEADIDLGDIEYYKIGNYEDRIFKNVSGDVDYSSEREDGAWYIKKNIGKVVLDGSESWQSYTDLGTNARVYFTKDNISVRSNGKCNYFNVITTDSWSTDETGIVFTPISVSLIGLKIPKSELGTQDVAGVKSWLSNHNTTGYYIMSTPTYTKITGTLTEQLEEVYNNLKSYNEQTNISQINNDLPFVINATTLKSLNNL